jgi:hypothetical protein
MPVHFVMVEFVLWLIGLFNVRQICEIDCYVCCLCGSFELHILLCQIVHPYMRRLLFYAALPNRYERQGELHMWCWTHDTPHLKNRKKLYETLL